MSFGSAPKLGYLIGVFQRVPAGSAFAVRRQHANSCSSCDASAPVEANRWTDSVVGVGIPLVLVTGEGWLNDAETKLIAELREKRHSDVVGRNGRPSVQQLNYVSLPLLVSLIRGARAVVFPSLYETFSLVTYEAAASGLPIVVSQLYGVEDLLQDGDNGFLIETTVDGVRKGLERILALSPGDRQAMGQRARLAASGCSEEHFVDAWRAFYLQQRPAFP